MTSARAEHGYQVPPRATSEDGQPRRVGLELELAGVPVEEALNLVEGRTICRCSASAAARS